MNLGERKKEILRAVIDRYVETAEPVSSKVIAADFAPSLSPATIRNEMAELEAMGLLEQPHTSAGRIPSPQGYRVYVNELMRRHRLSVEEASEINGALRSRVAALDRLLTDAGRIASRMTSLPAYALAVAPGGVTISRFDLIPVSANTFIIIALLSSATVRNKLVSLPASVPAELLARAAAIFNASFTGITEDKITPPLLDAAARAAGDTLGVVAVIAEFALELLCETARGDAHITGELSLFDHPEYRDVAKAQRLIRYLSDEDELHKLPAPEMSARTKVTIGPENLAAELRDSSVVVTRYDAGDDVQLLIGVVGPTRMDYSKVFSRLQYIAQGISTLLGGQLPPTADNERLTDE
ncbi:MAG: heat-inducible transcriptional repressor HrcA [Oscillospiraceae bacterium]|jgi:heat-inducible transcriptional repressor|nr:heat-inducible transcriptional repressor HrcA [Oscillospiraceae bacterium]